MQTDKPNQTDEPNQVQPKSNIRRKRRFPVNRQIVLTGPRSQVHNLVDRVPELQALGDPQEMVFSELTEEPSRSAFDTALRDRGDMALGTKSREGAEGRYWLRIQEFASRLVSGGDDPIVTQACGILDTGDRQLSVEEVLAKPEFASLGPDVFAEQNVVAGDPQSVGGSPATGMYANREAFPKQWAFGAEGVDLPSGLSGEDIRVGIFDTSPFDIPYCDLDEPYIIELRHVGSPLTLRVFHPSLEQQGPTQNMAPCPEHGLCVASLVHQVAPSCEIELVRVLNMYVEGEAFTLATQIGLFIDRVVRDKKRVPRPITGAVINLSLHVDKAGTKTEIVKNLEWQLGRAEAEGIVVVAAAGNASKADQARLPTQYPANIDTVVAVAALSQEGKHAFYANEGEVLAPGSGLIARVTHEPPISQGYQFVNGSSFATPLAAGLSALLLRDAQVVNQGNPPTKLKAKHLRKAMGVEQGKEPHIKVSKAKANLVAVSNTPENP